MQTIEEYVERLKKYSTQNIGIELALHIPSLRPKDTLSKPARNEDILPHFIKYSRVPVFHYQWSYMKSITDFFGEYFKYKKDYSVKNK